MVQSSDKATDSQRVSVHDAGSINGDADTAKPPVGEIKEIQGDAHFYETINAAPLDPLSKTSIQLYFILLVAALNATASGFDGVCFFFLQPFPIPSIHTHTDNEHTKLT